MAPPLQQNFDDGLQYAPTPLVNNHNEAPQSYNTSGAEYDRNTQPALEVEKSDTVRHVVSSYPEDVISEKPSQRSHGLRRSTWILLIALIVVIVIAAVTIGAVGGILSRKKLNSTPAPNNSGTAVVPQTTASFSSSTPSASHTTTLAPSETFSIISSPTLTISRDCPASNGTTVVTNDIPPQTFAKNCGWLYGLNDSPGNHSAFESTTSTLDACISLCSSYNVINGTGPQGKCSTVAWRTDLSQEYFGVCFGNFGAKGPGQGGDRSSTGNGHVLTDSALLLE